MNPPCELNSRFSSITNNDVISNRRDTLTGLPERVPRNSAPKKRGINTPSKQPVVLITPFRNTPGSSSFRSHIPVSTASHVPFALEHKNKENPFAEFAEDPQSLADIENSFSNMNIKNSLKRDSIVQGEPLRVVDNIKLNTPKKTKRPIPKSPAKTKQNLQIETRKQQIAEYLRELQIEERNLRKQMKTLKEKQRLLLEEAADLSKA